MHINQQPDTYPENFRALALTVLAGEAIRRKTQGSNFNTGPLYYSIVGTVKMETIFIRILYLLKVITSSM